MTKWAHFCADGVMLHTYCMPGGPYGAYNLGNTGVHEAGEPGSAVGVMVTIIMASRLACHRGSHNLGYHGRAWSDAKHCL